LKKGRVKAFGMFGVAAGAGFSLGALVTTLIMSIRHTLLLIIYDAMMCDFFHSHLKMHFPSPYTSQKAGGLVGMVSPSVTVKIYTSESFYYFDFFQL
jgi:hypothetical protein